MMLAFFCDTNYKLFGFIIRVVFFDSCRKFINPYGLQSDVGLTHGTFTALNFMAVPFRFIINKKSDRNLKSACLFMSSYLKTRLR